jgi:uncharacterized membrane protein YcfT
VTRMHWMDSLRGIAVLAVFIQHSVTIPHRAGIDGSDLLQEVNAFLVPVRVPLLLVLSGMFLGHSLGKPLRRYAAGKLQHIAWPLLVGSLIVFLLNPPDPTEIVTWLGPRHLWFLVTLLFCYALGVLTRWVPAWSLAAGLFALSLFPELLPNKPLDNAVSYGVYFFVGAALAPHVRAWQARAPLLLAVALGALGLSWPLWRHAVSGVPTVESVINLVVVLGFILAVLWAGPRLPRSQVFEWVGQRTMAYYIGHGMVMIAGAQLIASFASPPGWMVSSTLIAASLLLCTLWAWLPAGRVFLEFPLPRQRRSTALAVR